MVSISFIPYQIIHVELLGLVKAN